MKIGLFDSGLGGLIVTHSLMQSMPEYNYVYLGDTARIPYGDRSQNAIYELTKRGVEYLFRQDCQLVIIACNTASAEALSRLQRDYLPIDYPDRRILGVLVPAAEEAVKQTKSGSVGVIATRGTVDSGAYMREIHKLDSTIHVFQQAAPLLVPLVENNALKYGEPILRDYLTMFISKNIDVLVLGCTHYPFFKSQIRNMLGSNVKVISQDELLSQSLADYLMRHPEITGMLSKKGTRQFQVTDLSSSTSEVAAYLFGDTAILQEVII